MGGLKMTTEQREMLKRINDYANEVMPDIDPQKTPISYQLDKLTPIMKKIGEEQDKSLSDVQRLTLGHLSCLSRCCHQGHSHQ